jgi:hypothetical protein
VELAPINAARHLREPESDHDPTRRCDTDLLANEQAELESQAYGIGERLDVSGVYEEPRLNRANSAKSHRL